MKKLALLLVLTIVLAFSSVYATDVVTSPAPDTAVTSGEVANDTTENVEDLSNVSGEDVDTVSGEVTEDIHEGHDHDSETITSKSTVWGAVLAIVIVIIVVGLVAFLSKND